MQLNEGKVGLPAYFVKKKKETILKVPHIRTKKQYEEWEPKADWSYLEVNDTLWAIPPGRKSKLLCNVNFVQDDEPEEILYHLQGMESICFFTATQSESDLTFETLNALLRRKYEKASV